MEHGVLIWDDLREDSRVKTERPIGPLPVFLTLLLLCFTGVSTAAPQSAEEYFPFVIPWDDAAAAPFNMTERLSDAPAGKHGRIRADGDRLVFEDGTPSKLWGIGMSASAEFPPKDKNVATALVRKLLKYGFNAVRIRAIDAAEVGIYGPWLRSGKLDDAAMDRVDYFVAELRKAGIYYSLGINVSSPRHAARGSLQQTEYRRAPKRFNGVQLFDEATIEDTVRWYDAIMGHTNPYTKVKYGEDPAFAYVPGVAEDSIFHSYFSETDSLGQQNEVALRKLFNSYLTRRYPDRDDLSRAWREEGKRGLLESEDPANGSVEIPKWNERSGISQARMADLMQFFYEVDLAYDKKMRDAVERAGYRGLFTGTNNWFGPGNLLANHDAGNYLESQAYFDHPGREVEEGAEAVGNVSMIGGDTGKRAKSLYYGNLYRLFMTASVDRPLIVSEWNHSAWSDYCYEGPLLLTAYASFQGYRGLLIHTYFPRGLGVRAEYSNRALAWVGNPVLVALTPTLALAFRRGDIAEAKDPVVVQVGNSPAELMALAAENGENAQLGDGRVPLDVGFVHKLRVGLPGTEDRGGTGGRAESAEGNLKSSTGEILWHRNLEDGSFRVDAPRFQAAAGHLEGGEMRLRNASVQLGEHGAVTLIALDDQDLGTSREILVTAVSSFKNTNPSIKANTTRDGKVGRKIVTDAGSGPPLLKRVRGTLTLRSMLSERPHVYSVATAGALTELRVQETGRSGDAYQYGFELGSEDSPWYLIKF